MVYGKQRVGRGVMQRPYPNMYDIAKFGRAGFIPNKLTTKQRLMTPMQKVRFFNIPRINSTRGKASKHSDRSYTHFCRKYHHFPTCNGPENYILDWNDTPTYYTED